MAFIRISHKQSECIGCGLCVEAAPDYWQMNARGEAELLNPTGQRNGQVVAQGLDQDRDLLDAASSGCPVGIIRIG